MKTLILITLVVFGPYRRLFSQPSSLIGTDIIRERASLISPDDLKLYWSIHGQNNFNINNSNSGGGIARIRWGQSVLGLKSNLFQHASINMTLLSLSYGHWLSPSLHLMAGMSHTRWNRDIENVPLNNMLLALQYQFSEKYVFRLNAFNIIPSKVENLSPAQFEWIVQRTWSADFSMLIFVQKTLGTPINIALDLRYRPLGKFTARLVFQPNKESVALEGSYSFGRIQLMVGSEYNLQLGASPYFMLSTNMSSI